MTLHVRFSKSVISLIFFSVAVLLSVGCSRENFSKQKTITAWICSDANFKRFASKDSVDFYLDKIKATGFNRICVDVKGADGQVLYDSEFLPQLKNEDSFVLENRGWDYLDYFIKQAHKRGLSVMVSVAPFSVGVACNQFGAVYQRPELKEYTCVKYTPKGMIKLEEDLSEVGVNLNPALKYSQDYGIRTLTEVLSKYDADALCLDYTRYPGGKTDFSDSSRVLFENYLGCKLDKFPEDIFSYSATGDIVPGKYYKEWWTWRAKVIRDFIAQVKLLRDGLRPDCKLEYWAASWLHAIYQNGQNWGSENVKWYEGFPWATQDYNKAAFAEQLDVFITGTYLEKVWNIEDNESIEYGLMRSNRDIAGACSVHGSIYAINHLDEFADACYLCLRDTEGLMVFDLCQIISNDLWDEIKSGIDRYNSECATSK